MLTAKNPTCLICRKKAHTKFLEVGEFTYYRCKHCTGIFVDPIRGQDFYLDTDTYLKDTKLYVGRIDPYGQRWIIEQFERLYMEKMKSPVKGTFFEVGAGVGYLCLFALARGWNAKGIETSERAVKYGKSHLKADLSVSTIEEYDKEEVFDAIAMVEVLEHFIDPIKAITALRKLSGSHTFLFGTTPNTDSDHWRKSEQNIYVPQDHIFLFNEKSIRIFADKANIHDLTIEYFGSGDKHDSNLMYAGVISA